MVPEWDMREQRRKCRDMHVVMIRPALEVTGGSSVSG